MSFQTQDLLFRHLDRTFGSKIGLGEEATEGQEKKTEGEVEGVRGGQGGGEEGGVDMDLEGWGGIRLFGKSVSAKRGRSEGELSRLFFTFFAKSRSKTLKSCDCDLLAISDTLYMCLLDITNC